MFRSIPVITKNLLIVNFLTFVATLVLERYHIYLSQIGGLHFFLDGNFHLYQFFTYMFIHSTQEGFMAHVFFNMFAVWMFGCVMENVWGAKKFLFYYIFCGVGAGIIQELVQLSELFFSANPVIRSTIGASGCVYGILLAFGMTFPNERIFIFPLPIPIKAKWFVVGYAAIELYLAANSSNDGVAHMAHLGGMLFGFLMIRYWNRHPDSRYNRSSGQAFFDNLKRNFEKRRGTNTHMHVEQGGGAATKEEDMEYNARKKQNQEEIDAILDKIRKSGYDSLTKEEKQRLFDASRNL